MLRIVLAVLHLLALGLGLAAIAARARALRRLTTTPDIALRDALKADNWWGIAAVLWLGTGLWRWFGETEKSATYYFANYVFHAKLGLFLLILALEIWPMITLVRWRIAGAKKSLAPAAELAPTGRRIAQISDVQLLLLVAMIVAAVMMARGYGAF